MRQQRARTIAEAVRFSVVGAVATLLHYLIYMLLIDAMPTNIAYAVGYVASFCGNYLATCYFTFHTRPSWARFMGMVGAHAANFVLHFVLLNLFLWLGVAKGLAPLPVYAIAVPVNFLLVRYLFKVGSMN